MPEPDYDRDMWRTKNARRDHVPSSVRIETASAGERHQSAGIDRRRSVPTASAVEAAAEQQNDDEDDEKGIGIHGGLLAKLPWGVNPIATLRFLPSGDGAGVDRSARIADETDQRHGVVAQWGLAHRETPDARGATPCRGSLVTERPVGSRRL